MATSRLPPGAWLSGFMPAASAGPGLNPPVGPHAANNPPVVHGASHNPPVVSRSAANPPVMHGFSGAPGALVRPPFFVAGSVPGQWIDTRLGPMPTEPTIPWAGIDPDWVWEGGADALLAQALRKVRNRIVPPRDPRQPGSALEAPLGQAATSALWRWDGQYRISAAVAELLGRLVIQGYNLWWVPSPSRQLEEPPAAATSLFTLSPPGPRFDYSEQIDAVLRAAVEREDRLPEILTQANDIGVFFDAITGIDRAQAPRLRELLDTAWEVATHLVMALKNNVGQWRPFQRSGRVVPVIETPGHGSLPSGHATMSMLAAEILSALLYPEPHPRRSALDALARRIAFNRVVAGVHFPMDSFVGAELARQLARVFVAAGTGGPLPAPEKCIVRRDSRLTELPLLPTGVGAAPPPPPDDAVPTADPIEVPRTEAPVWQAMWAAAKKEVDQRRV